MSEARIPYGNGLIQAFEKSLQTEFSSNICLTRKPSKSKGSFTITTIEDKNAISREGIPNETYWVTFKATFVHWIRSDIVETVSVSIFQKSARGNWIKTFRAEWDGRDDANSTYSHAQPHWHFAMDADDFRTALEFDQQDDTEPVAREFGEETQTDLRFVDISHFHFAMTPLWQQGVPLCHRQIFKSDQELRSWFDSLSKYIAMQLIYISSKIGDRPKTIENFGPNSGG